MSISQDHQFDLNNVDNIFDRIDTDANGELDMEEFQQLLREAGYLPTKMKIGDEN